jgi:hypothetical protein
MVYICSKACHMYSEMLLTDGGVYTVQHAYFKHKYHAGDLTEKLHPQKWTASASESGDSTLQKYTAVSGNSVIMYQTTAMRGTGICRWRNVKSWYVLHWTFYIWSDFSVAIKERCTEEDRYWNLIKWAKHMKALVSKVLRTVQEQTHYWNNFVAIDEIWASL